MHTAYKKQRYILQASAATSIRATSSGRIFMKFRTFFFNLSTYSYFGQSREKQHRLYRKAYTCDLRSCLVFMNETGCFLRKMRTEAEERAEQGE